MLDDDLGLERAGKRLKIKKDRQCKPIGIVDLPSVDRPFAKHRRQEFRMPLADGKRPKTKEVRDVMLRYAQHIGTRD